MLAKSILPLFLACPPNEFYPISLIVAVDDGGGGPYLLPHGHSCPVQGEPARP